MDAIRGGRRLIVVGVLASILVVPAIALGFSWARSRTRTAVVDPPISITAVSASPASVSRFAGPKAVAIRYQLSAPGTVKVTVSGSSGVVRTLLSHATPRSGKMSATWDLKNSTGAWVGDGTYTIKISVVDAEGHAGTPNPATAAVYVDNTAPHSTITGVAPPTFSPSIGESSTITFSLTDANRNLPLGATLEVRDPSGTLVHAAPAVSLAQGSGRTLSWGGASMLATTPAGAYSAQIVVRDAAGNIGTSTVKPIYVNGYGAPRSMDTRVFISGTAVVRSDTGADGLTHVVWNDHTGSSPSKIIRYRRLDEFGNTVVGPVSIDAGIIVDDALLQAVPDVSADASGAAYVVWRGEGPTMNEHAIWIARVAPDGTIAWRRPIVTENYPQAIQYPRVSAGPDGTAHVVCAQTGAPSTIYYAAFRRNGASELGLASLSESRGTALRKFPNVQTDSAGRVHVLWFESTPANSTSAKSQLFYTRLVPRNGTFAVDIDRRQLTDTTIAPAGLSPSHDWAPEMAANDGATNVYAVWGDQAPGWASYGIRHMRLPASQTEALPTPRRIFDCTTANTTKPALGASMPMIVCNGNTQTVVFRASEITAGDPIRLWQMEVSDASVTRPFVVTAGKRIDVCPSLTTAPGGHARLFYIGDTGDPWPGSSTTIPARLYYKDLAAEPKANDRARHDLQVDAAHTYFTSTPATPRQNTPVRVSAEVRNAGWSPSLGGTAKLEYEGVVVDTASFGPLSVEGTTAVQLDWTVPDDATRTPAPLVVSVTPSGVATQTSAGNDETTVSVYFLTPPKTANLYVGVSDETWGRDDYGSSPVDDATVSLSGTTVDGAPFAATQKTVGYGTVFSVPLGSYRIGASKAGCITSDPTSQAVTLLADPTDRYKVVATPAFSNELWLNRWARIDGFVRESVGTTPVAGVTAKIMSSGDTSVTALDGTFHMLRMGSGDYTLRFTKPGYERTDVAVSLAPAEVRPLNVPMPRTTKGYLVGTITDEGGYPALNDPSDPTDDAKIIVRTSTGTWVAEQQPLDARFDFTLDAGTYSLEFQAPGYITKTVAVTILAGVEIDKSTWLEMNVSGMQHASSGQHWCTSWTMNADWFGSQPPGSPFEAFSIQGWWGLYRFKFDGDYQTVGTSTELKAIDVWTIGEYWNAICMDGVTPPPAPHTFHTGEPEKWWWPYWENTSWYDIPAISDRNAYQLAAVRVDQVDIVDGRDWSVVSSIKQQWNSVNEPDGHRYGRVGSYTDPLPLPGYSHTVPWSDQVVRLWLTVGREQGGAFAGSTFHDFGFGDMGSLFQAGGFDQQVLCWDVSSGEVWVDPALSGYPTIP